MADYNVNGIECETFDEGLAQLRAVRNGLRQSSADAAAVEAAAAATQAAAAAQEPAGESSED